MKRTLTVAVLSGAALTAFVGTSGAAPVLDAAAAPAHGATIAGISVTTLAWFVVGVLFLAGGLVAASKSGKQPTAVRREPVVATSDESDVTQAALAV